MFFIPVQVDPHPYSCHIGKYRPSFGFLISARNFVLRTFVQKTHMSVVLGDVTLSCGRCQASFLFSIKEQEHYKAKNWQNPKICAGCRAARKLERRKQEEENNANANNKTIAISRSSGCDDFSSAVIDLINKKRKARDDEDGAGEAGVRGNTKVRRTVGGKEKETDQHKIETRLKQIQYGYNTVAYDNYIAQVPKTQRNQNYEEHPRTPDPYLKQAKRAFDGRLRKWRRELHRWDVEDGCEGEIGAETGEAGKQAPEKLSRTKLQQQHLHLEEEKLMQHLQQQGEIEPEIFGNDDVFISERIPSEIVGEGEKDDEADIL